MGCVDADLRGTACTSRYEGADAETESTWPAAAGGKYDEATLPSSPVGCRVSTASSFEAGLINVDEYRALRCTIHKRGRVGPHANIRCLVLAIFVFGDKVFWFFFWKKNGKINFFQIANYKKLFLFLLSFVSQQTFFSPFAISTCRVQMISMDWWTLSHQMIPPHLSRMPHHAPPHPVGITRCRARVFKRERN